MVLKLRENKDYTEDDFKKEMIELAQRSDDDIDFSDIPEITDFSNWEPNPFFKPVKAPLSAKIDADALAWLKSHKNYSQFLNGIIREKMVQELNKFML